MTVTNGVIASVLGKIGHPDGLPFVVKMLKDRDRNDVISAIEAAGMFRDDSVVELIEPFLVGTDREQKVFAVDALLTLGTPLAIEALREALLTFEPGYQKDLENRIEARLKPRDSFFIM